MVITKKYLVVPINPYVTVKRIFLTCDEKLIFDFDARLDFVNPTCYQYVNVERYIGLDIFITSQPEIELNFSFSDEKIVHPRDTNNRPLAHFTAGHGWLNDPNGLVQYNGVYHVFFQHNPAGVDWGNMTWGHAISKDLIHWEELDDAIFPDEEGSIFSGGAIMDYHNVSGLSPDGSPVMLAYYTAAGGDREISKNKPFTQCLTYSIDGGKTLKKYAGNPIIGHIAGENRDPIVVYVAEMKMYVLSLFLDEHEYVLMCSDDLIHWKEFQRIIAPEDAECPNLILLPVAGTNEKKWVFMGASDTYAVGAFKNGRYVPEQEFKHYYYHGTAGRTSYAAQAFTDERGRAIRITWENMRSPEASFWGQLGIPCEMSLKKVDDCYNLQTNPVQEFDDNCEIIHEINDGIVAVGDVLKVPLGKGAYDISITVPSNSPDFAFNFFGIYFAARVSQNLFDFCGIDTPLKISRSGSITIRIIVDTLGTEVFIDDGLVYSTSDFMPDFGIARLVLSSSGKTDLNYSLKISKFITEQDKG